MSVLKITKILVAAGISALVSVNNQSEAQVKPLCIKTRNALTFSRHSNVIDPHFTLLLSSSAKAKGRASLDIDQDSRGDVIPFQDSSPDMTILSKFKVGRFGTINKITLPFVPVDAVAADFDNDSFPDVIITNGSQVYILFNNKAGSFLTPTQVGTLTSTLPIKLTAADYNGDGFVDIAFVTNLAIRTTKGNGTRTVATLPWTTAASISSNFIFYNALNLETVTIGSKPGVVMSGVNDGFLLTPILAMRNASTPSTIKFTIEVASSLNPESTVSQSTSMDYNGDSIVDLVSVLNVRRQIQLYKGTSAKFTPEITLSPSAESALDEHEILGVGDLISLEHQISQCH